MDSLSQTLYPVFFLKSVHKSWNSASIQYAFKEKCRVNIVADCILLWHKSLQCLLVDCGFFLQIIKFFSAVTHVNRKNDEIPPQQ